VDLFTRRNFLLAAGALPLAAKPASPRTIDAFGSYSDSVSAPIEKSFVASGALWVEADAERKRRVHAGEIVAENVKAPEITGGLVHHWIGAVFMPGVTLQRMLKADRDYNNQKVAYAPDVVESKLLSKKGDEYSIYLRFMKKAGITVYLDTWHDVRYNDLDPKRTFSRSVCRKVQQVENAGEPNEKLLPPGEGLGVLWAMDSVWKLAERDGGLYAELDALTLTRDLPFGLGVSLGPIVRHISEGAVESTLSAKRRSVGA
jgi:hypothetical protein